MNAITLSTGRTIPIANVGDYIEDLLEENTSLKEELGRGGDDQSAAKLQAHWRLTPKEARLLLALHARKGAVVSKDSLMSAAYSGADDEPGIKIIDVFVCKIRNKVGEGVILTVWGQGYRLSAGGVLAVDVVLRDGFAAEPAVVTPRDTTKRAGIQAHVLAVLHRIGKSDVPTITAAIPPEEGANETKVRMALSSAKARHRAKVVDWAPSPRGYRRAYYAVTPKGLGYLRATLPEVLDETA